MHFDKPAKQLQMTVGAACSCNATCINPCTMHHFSSRDERDGRNETCNLLPVTCNLQLFV